MSFGSADLRYMKRALALASRGAGLTSPNPMVGAVLAHQGKILGEGFHKRAGGAHAEILALRSARGAPRSAIRRSTLYVTLEPCSTYGRTPPCTDAIIASGIKRVVIGAIDPNPRHGGRGVEILRRAGIRVETGLLADEAAALNESFNKWITTGLPLVTVKAALSLDGKIATRTGDSKWITSEPSRKLAHAMRARADAVMVGSRTVIVDNPRLTARFVRAKNQPLRVIVDSRGKTPLRARVFSKALRGRTLVLTTRFAPKKWRAALQRRGVEVVVVPARSGRLDLRRALRELGRRDITNVLVEGGGKLIGALFDARLVDKLAFFYAPKIIGGADAQTAVQGAGIRRLADARLLQNLSVRSVGEDFLVTASVRQDRPLA
jgi:diaminohydroxyphosphoribosylaminopyrimidine deaminase/5-amino-6-(5-phosphoribosylamino)uracil reductase